MTNPLEKAADACIGAVVLVGRGGVEGRIWDEIQAALENYGSVGLQIGR